MKSTPELALHPIKSVLPALEVMVAKGYSSLQCLRGTGMLQSQLKDAERRISYQQELAFHRNLLELSSDPLIGLALGKAYLPQRYGIYGYALFSAATLRHGLSFAAHFGKLTFSHLNMDFSVTGKLAFFSFSDGPSMEPELLHLFCDREVAAVEVACSAIIGKPLPVEQVYLIHDGHSRRQEYRDFFQCPVEFLTHHSGLAFNSELLDAPLPHGDAESSQYFQQQCQLLIAKMSRQSHFIDDVRQLILERPGYFPDMDYIAEKLQMSTRTLRRRLKQEQSNYQIILNEVRYNLAQQYLRDTRLPLEDISELLGYSEPGNFSHAFKRWSEMSPRQYRQQS